MAEAQGPKKEPPVLAQVGHYLGLATILPACVFVGWLMGYGLDRWLGTGFFKIVFLLFGIAAGFIQLIRDLMRETGQK
jgi:F0F1-type ATP synthase assembly protein I